MIKGRALRVANMVSPSCGVPLRKRFKSRDSSMPALDLLTTLAQVGPSDNSSNQPRTLITLFWFRFWFSFSLLVSRASLAGLGLVFNASACLIRHLSFSFCIVIF